MMISKKIVRINRDLLSKIESDRYKGYDPYDYLNSILFKSSPLNNIYLTRLLWIQFGKRSPINFRKILLVPKERNPKGISLIILGLINDFQRTQDEYYLNEAKILANWLINSSVDRHKWKYPAWGYNFDWQSKAFYVEKGTPNVIATVYAAKALHQLANIIDDKKMKELSIKAAFFIQDKLLVHKNDQTYIRYIPNQNTFVHNANLWGAAWIARVGKEINNKNMIHNSLDCTYETLRSQKIDGSWEYGKMSHHKFIDGFHTGFALEALNIIKNNCNT